MQSVRGVGLLISPNLIITAACNIYDKRISLYSVNRSESNEDHIASFKEFLFFPR